MTNTDNNFITKTTCPYCGKKNDRALNPQNEQDRPDPGSLSVCIQCTELSEFDENLGLIKFDINKLDRDDFLHIRKMQRMIKKGREEYNELHGTN